VSQAGEKTRKPSLTDLLDPRLMARLDQLDLLSRRILQGKMKGERQSKRRGQGSEFADHRQYVHGDDVRFLDWNIFGRLDQLFMKMFLEEQDLSLHILVDASASTAMGDPPKAKYLKSLAAALAYVGLVNNNRVSVYTFADGVSGTMMNLRGRRYLSPMGEFLAGAPAAGTSNFEKACRQLAAGRMGSGITVVLSDFFFKEGFEAGLRRLVTDRYDLFAIQVISPEEKSPPFKGDLKLVDIEDADASEITVTGALMKHYQRILATYCGAIKDFCVRRGATYVLTDTSQPIDRLVLDHLRRRRLLG